MVTAPPRYCVIDTRTDQVVFVADDWMEACNWRRWNLSSSGVITKPQLLSHPPCLDDDCPRGACPHFFSCHGHWGPPEQLNTRRN